MAADPTTIQTGGRGRDRAEEVAGLDALDRAPSPRDRGISRLWREIWPKAAAIGLALVAWQAVVSTRWRPDYVLPGPGPVLGELWTAIHTGDFWLAVAITMRRALVGYAVAVVIGSLVGMLLVRSRVMRTAGGSLITGLQTMPSIAWFPLAILLFQLSESAILFVVVLGAAPAVANGLISGVDYVPPQLLRAGQVLGARGLTLYRHVVLPASLPAYVSGLKQGWAFAWRSLMAGELLVVVAHEPSIGARLQFAREFADAQGLLAMMIVVLIVGVIVDSAFARVDNGIRRRRGISDITS